VPALRGGAIRMALATLCAAAALPASASAVTITLGPPSLSSSDPFASCGVGNSCTTKTFVPTAVPGATLATPADGTITSWRVKGVLPYRLFLRVVSAAGGGRFQGVMKSGVAQQSDGNGSTPAAIGIKAGQQLGIELESDSPHASTSSVLGDATAPGAAWSEYAPGLPDNATAAPTSTGTGSVPMFNATVELFEPEVFSMTSTQGPSTGGDVVALTGTHLAVVDAVTFGGVPAAIQRADNNQVVAVSPPHPPGVVEVVVHTAGGSSIDSAADRYQYVPVAGPPPPDTVKPALRAFRIAPNAFHAIKGASRAVISKRRGKRQRKRLGARVFYRSSEAATVRFSVERQTRRRGGKRYLKVRGSFAHAGRAGTNSFKFTGRVNGKLLPRGRYRLEARAIDSAGNRSQKVVRRGFRIVG